jgi:hypothetical protein
VPLFVRQLERPKRLAVGERVSCPLQHTLFLNSLLFSRLRLLGHTLQPTLDRIQIRQRELRFDDVAIAHGIHTAQHMGHVRVLETAQNVRHRIDLADVAQELVPQPLAFRGALHQPGDVDELNDGRHLGLRAAQPVDEIQSRIRDLDRADVRVHRAERIVLGGSAGGGERVEKRRLAHVGQADDADLEHWSLGNWRRRAGAASGAGEDPGG